MDKQSLLFSAYSLQAYVDCARRFELTYLEELSWPAVEREPLLENEKHMADGRRFHEMIHRDVLGIPVCEPHGDERGDLLRWWGNFRTHRPVNGPGKRFAEQHLVGSVGGRPLTATCDLIVIDDKKDPCTARIFDWKTWRRRRPRQWLQARLQTRVYPFLLVQIGSGLSGGTNGLDPEEIEMVYWYADFPEAFEVFSYSQIQFAEDEAYLSDLVEEIMGQEGTFSLTEHEKTCSFCAYRSFCGRGGAAGNTEKGDEPDSELYGEEKLLTDIDDYESITL